MKLTFLEFPSFTRWLLEVGDDEVLRGLQNELMRQPDKGSVIQGAGGFRKVRVKLSGRGKSGGARAIYLYLPEIRAVVFVTLYTKSKKTDLEAKEKQALRFLAVEIKEELLCKRKK